MKKMNRSWRMMWSLAVMGMVSIPASLVAAAQSVSLPEGTYHIVARSAAAGVGVGQGTHPQVKDDLFAGTEIFEKGASSVTEINMGPESLGLVEGNDGKRAHSMILNVVRTYSYDKPGLYRMEDVDAFRNKLNSGDWYCSVHTRDLKSGESTDVCNKRRSDDISERAIITVGPKELTFIHTIRKKGASEGELSDFPMMLSVPGLPALAMLDPDQFVNMKVAMNMVDSGEMQAKIDSAMKGLHQLDTPEMQKQIDSAMKSLHGLDSSEMQKKMDEAMKQLKETQKDLKIDPDQPKEPE